MFWIGASVGFLLGAMVMAGVIVIFVPTTVDISERRHQEVVEQIDRGHAIMKENGAAIERIAAAIEAYLGGLDPSDVFTKDQLDIYKRSLR